MSISPRTLAATGGAFVLLALAFAFLRPGGFWKSDGTAASAPGAAGWDGNGKSGDREQGKRPRRSRNLGMDDPEVQREAEEWYQDLLARHPEFRVEFKDVPDEENGFLQFLDLLDDLKPGDPFNASLPIDDDLRGMLDGTKPFDAALLDAWLAKNPELFQRILGIAEAPGQSVKGVPMDRYHFIPARAARSMGQLLQASARAAMDRGDAEEALRFHRASMNLAAHFDGIEIPSLLAKTVSILLRMSASKSFHEHILHRLVGNPDALATWRETMPLPGSINDTAPVLFTGEWHLATRMHLLPALISGETGILGESPRNIDPAEHYAVVESYTSRFSQYIRQSSTTPAADLINGSRGLISHDPYLSPEADDLVEMFTIGSRAWLNGLGRFMSIAAQNDALLAIALGEEPPPEPITGEPFLWDPATTTLTPPAALAPYDFKIEPLKLPSPR